MAISSPNTLTGISRVKDLYAFTLDGQSAASNYGTAQTDQMEDFIEMALNVVAAEGLFSYHERNTAGFITVAPYSTGDCDLTAGSTAVTSDNGATDWSTGTPVNADKALLKHGDADLPYHISAVGGAQSLTIAPAWGGSTKTDQSYEIVNSDYALASDVWDLLSIHEIHPDAVELRIMTYSEFLDHGGMSYVTGRPETAVLMGSDPSASGASGTAIRIRLYPYPDQVYSYTYSYRAVPTYPSGTFENAPQAMNLVLWKALEYAFADRGDLAQVEVYGTRYRRELGAFKRRDVRRTQDSPVRLAPQWQPKGVVWIPEWMWDVGI